MIPARLGAKELEELVLHRAVSDEKHGMYTLDRCGVRGTFHDGAWQPVDSFPDFNGTCGVDGIKGLGFWLDTKVCSQSSYDLSGGTHKSFKHQLKFMRRRAKFGAVCFLLMHWNERILTTKTEPAMTVAFPIYDCRFWDDYDSGSIKKISRGDAQNYGISVSWNLASDRAKKPTPDILATVKAVDALVQGDT